MHDTGTAPDLRIEEFFLGKTYASGIFEDRFGTVRREIEFDIDGSRDGEWLVLDERIAYDDGEREMRMWRIRATGDGLYEGLCPDVLGTAIGRRSGSTIRWRYRFNLKVGRRQVLVDFDERMFLRPGGIALDRSYLSKWGVRLGAVTVCYRKR
jgi:hypothetical protein